MTDREGQGNHLNLSQWGGISPRDIRIQIAAAPKASTEKKTSRKIAIQLSLRSELTISIIARRTVSR
jgi:hypothetical protein